MKFQLSYQMKLVIKQVMNVNARMLPRLNLCYLQKKAFENHRKKIGRIKSSLQISKREANHFKNNTSNKEQRTYKFQTVSEDPAFRSEIDVHMTPLRKKVHYEMEKQNYRLFKAIQKCQPTISRREMQKHSVRSHEDMDRMNKFKVDPSSHRKILKCKLSLQKISSLQKQKNSRVTSRFIPSCQTTTSKQKIQSVNTRADLPKSDSNRQLPRYFSHSPSTGEDRFKSHFNQNLRKIKQHFEDKSFSLIAEARLKGFREKSESNQKNMLSPQIHKWKTRYFRTQMESYE